MQRVHKSANVPFSAEQLFALVDDVSSYPEFVPNCVAATERSRNETEVIGTLKVAKGPISQQFTTKNSLHFPEKIVISLVDGPFQHLSGEWVFTPVAVGSGAPDSSTGHCQVSLALEFTFSNFFLKKAFGPIFTLLAGQMVDAFSRRARQVYG